MRVGLNNFSLSLVKNNYKNVSFGKSAEYVPTIPYSNPEIDNLYKSMVKPLIVGEIPAFREDDEIRYALWEDKHDKSNAIIERLNWNEFLTKEEQQESAQREALYMNEASNAFVVDENKAHHFYQEFSDGTSIISHYSEEGPNGFPVIDFQWFSKRDEYTGWASEATRIRFNKNNDKRMNISSTYPKRFYLGYNNKGYKLVKQHASVNIETGAVKTRFDKKEQSELKKQVEKILFLAQNAGVMLPYSELCKQLEMLG